MQKLKGIKLNRTVGIEVEGYTKEFRKLLNGGIRHSVLKRDASLSNSYGYIDSSRSRGVEVVSNPLRELDKFDDIFEDIQDGKWNIGRGKASTHVHVDASDFTLHDKVKMSVFMKEIEEAMFLMVKESRYRNRYCRLLSEEWRTLIRRSNALGFSINDFDNIDQLMFSISNKERRLNTGRYQQLPRYNKYTYINIFDTQYPTIEFRLFHSIRKSSDAKKFALLSYNIIELVKNSSVEQLSFISNSINECNNADEMLEKFTESIGIDFKMKIMNTSLRDTINRRKSRELAV